MTSEALYVVVLPIAMAALHLVREGMRRYTARMTEQSRTETLVRLMAHCGPDALLIDRRSDGAVLTVRSGAVASDDSGAHRISVAPGAGEVRV
ncbi:hypothetical protein [Streptomyces sp. NPDC005953]|uniref:hypothetical protein n=1 Tax=unclassified Streptomyces TaxID=2593676 RepID=UPI0033C5EB2A